MRILIVVRPKSLSFEKIIVHTLIVVQSLIVVTLYNFLINFIIKLETVFRVMILYLKQVDYELDKKLNDYDILIDNEMIWPLALKFKYKTVLTDTQFLFKAIKCI